MAYLAFRNMRGSGFSNRSGYYDEVKDKVLDSGVELLKQAKRDGHGDGPTVRRTGLL